MKTSLICLLLLAAVVCAAPQAWEMPGEKRAGISEMMKEKIAEKRKEIAEKMREIAEEKSEEMPGERRVGMTAKMREESENAVAAAKSDGEAESRYGYCFGVCYSVYGEVGCYYDFCYRRFDKLFYDYYFGCWCCSDYAAPYSCYGYNY